MLVLLKSRVEGGQWRPRDMDAKDAFVALLRRA